MKVLHIGLHKTGSTFLQRYFFPVLEGVAYYGTGDIEALWRRGGELTPAKTAVWSTEAALGWPYPVPERPRIGELLVLCRDLGIRHLMAVKRPFPAWIRSVYFQTLNEGSSASLEAWWQRHREGLEAWRHVFSDLTRATERAGVELFVVDYADLRGQPEVCLSEVARWLGTTLPASVREPRRTNASSYGEAFVGTYRALNQLAEGRRIGAAMRMLRLPPRKLMQRGQLGAVMQRISRREIDVPPAVAALDWEDT